MTRAKLLKKVEKVAYFLKGSMTELCGNCNRARCVCSEKTDKRSYRLTYKDKQQRTKVLYVPRDRVSEAHRLLRNNSHLKKLLDELLLENIKQFKSSA